MQISNDPNNAQPVQKKGPDVASKLPDLDDLDINQINDPNSKFDRSVFASSGVGPQGQQNQM